MTTQTAHARAHDHATPEETARTPEQRAWQTHRSVLATVPPPELGRRGCIGLAMLVHSQHADSWLQLGDGEDGGRRTFVPDDTVAWASLVDVPGPYFNTGRAFKEVQWAAVRPTTVRYGVPALVRDSERVADDFRSALLPGAGIDAAESPQLFRVFNALNWAMSSYAFAFRPAWRPGRPALAAALGYDHDPDTPLLSYGGATYAGLAHPVQWMPRSFIAFPVELRDRLHDLSFNPPGANPDNPIGVPEGMRAAFVDDIGQYLAYRARFAGRVESVKRTMHQGWPAMEFVLSGDRGEREVVRFFRDSCQVRKPVRARFEPGEVVAEERFSAPLPEDWYSRGVENRWDRWVHRLMSVRWSAVLRFWFDRQGVELVPGFVHLPGQIASRAAVSSAVGQHLLWEVSGALEYYDDSCDAIVFPPIPVERWYDLSGFLPGDVAYDFAPDDPRFESYHDQVARLRREQDAALARAEQAATPDPEPEEKPVPKSPPPPPPPPPPPAPEPMVQEPIVEMSHDLGAEPPIAPFVPECDFKAIEERVEAAREDQDAAVRAHVARAVELRAALRTVKLTDRERVAALTGELEDLRQRLLPVLFADVPDPAAVSKKAFWGHVDAVYDAMTLHK